MGEAMSETFMEILRTVGPILLSFAGASLLLVCRMAFKAVSRILEINRREHDEMLARLHECDMKINLVQMRFEDNAEAHQNIQEQTIRMLETITSHGERLTHMETTCELARTNLQENISSLRRQ